MESLIFFAATGSRFSVLCPYHWFLAAAAIFTALKAGGMSNTKALIISGGMLAVPMAYFIGPQVFSSNSVSEPAALVENTQDKGEAIDTEDLSTLNTQEALGRDTLYILSQADEMIEIEAINAETLESIALPLPERLNEGDLQNAHIAWGPSSEHEAGILYLLTEVIRDPKVSYTLYALDLASLTYTTANEWSLTLSNPESGSLASEHEALKILSFRDMAVQGRDVFVYSVALTEKLERLYWVFKVRNDEPVEYFSATTLAREIYTLYAEDDDVSIPLFSGIRRDGERCDVNLVAQRDLTNAFPDYKNTVNSLKENGYSIREIIRVVPEKALYFNGQSPIGEEVLIEYSAEEQEVKVIKEGGDPIWSVTRRTLEAA